MTGAGTVEFLFDYWASVFDSNSVFNVTGTTIINAQNDVDFLSGSHAQKLGSVTLESGTLNLSSGLAVSAASLTETSGAVLTGSDPLTVSGLTTWTGGTMSGTGSTVADGTLQLGASGDPTTSSISSVRTLDVSGGGTLEPRDTLEQSYGSTFVNTALDTLDVLAGVSWQSDLDGTAEIDNQGAMVVGAGISTATITGGRKRPLPDLPWIDRGALRHARPRPATAPPRARSRPASRSPRAARFSSTATSPWEPGRASAARGSSRFPAAIFGSPPARSTAS